MNNPHLISRRLTILFALAVLNGCASYFSHYGVFPAENSEGEPRQVMLSWQTAEYPGWWLRDNQSTPIRLVTQCSERIWRLTDDSHRNPGACGEGIRACGIAGQDRVATTGNPAGQADLCVSVNAGNGQSQVTAIGRSLTLLMSCQPVRPRLEENGEEMNMDYLRASTVPYRVYIRKTPRGALNGRPPEMDESACDAE